MRVTPTTAGAVTPSLRCFIIPLFQARSDCWVFRREKAVGLVNGLIKSSCADIHLVYMSQALAPSHSSSSPGSQIVELHPLDQGQVNPLGLQNKCVIYSENWIP